MELEIKRIDHWGIVAGIIKDLGITQLIDQKVGTDNQEILTTGDVVAGMIINGLGFASRPLMLSPQFFENKALDILIKPGVKPEHFNRHKIGRALDAISEFGCEKLFNFIALSACKIEGIETRFGHADTTSYSLYGEYNCEENDENGQPIVQAINITHGYSKAHRPDLKQVVQELVTSQDGGIPFITKTLSGNASDSKILRERAEALMDEFARSGPRCLVADSKLYAAETAPTLNKVNFITRVPATINLEQETIDKSLAQNNDWQVISANYKYQEFPIDYCGIEDQRWLVFYSKQAHERSKKSLDKVLKKEKERIEKELLSLQKKDFGCEADASKELKSIAKKWHYHKVSEQVITEAKNYKIRGRPTAETPYEITYKIQAKSMFYQAAFNQELDHRSCFVLATNMSQQALSAAETLDSYKGQDYTEKGFAFLKKSEFFTSSLNLEKPGRIEALLMIMVLSLLVYSIAQRRLRKQLEKQNGTIPNQLGKPAKNPTMRWVFQLFEGVNFVITKVNEVENAFVEGLNSLRQKIINLLGQNVLKIYQATWSKG